MLSLNLSAKMEELCYHKVNNYKMLAKSTGSLLEFIAEDELAMNTGVKLLVQSPRIYQP